MAKSGKTSVKPNTSASTIRKIGSSVRTVAGEPDSLGWALASLDGADADADADADAVATLDVDGVDTGTPRHDAGDKRKKAQRPTVRPEAQPATRRPPNQAEDSRSGSGSEPAPVCPAAFLQTCKPPPWYEGVCVADRALPPVADPCP